MLETPLSLTKKVNANLHYVETFANLVGNGDDVVGAERVCSILASKFPEQYLQEGQKRGLAIKKQFDTVDLGAMAVDNNLK
jgi:hypothetical protein